MQKTGYLLTQCALLSSCILFSGCKDKKEAKIEAPVASPPPVTQPQQLDQSLLGQPIDALSLLIGAPAYQGTYVARWDNGIGVQLKAGKIEDIRLTDSYTGPLPDGLSMKDPVGKIEESWSLKPGYVADYVTRKSNMEKGIHAYYLPSGTLSQVILSRPFEPTPIPPENVTKLTALAGDTLGAYCNLIGLPDVMMPKKGFGHWTHLGVRIWHDETLRVHTLQFCAPFKQEIVPGIKLGMERTAVIQALADQVATLEGDQILSKTGMVLAFGDGKLIHCTQTIKKADAVDTSTP